jgi:hypothetical protein
VKRCPVCLQPLPQDFDRKQLAARLSAIESAATKAQKKALEVDFHKRLPAIIERESQRIQRSTESKLQGKLLALRRRAEKAERDKDREVDRIRRHGERTADRSAKLAAQMAVRQSEAQIDKLNAAREKDRARFEADRARLQSQLDQMSRKLDKQQADLLGKEAEIDLLSELNRAFPGDRIQAVRRGVKGADIVHEIIEDAKRLGRIVYESKNVSSWSNNFISQAKKYQTQYDTPNVIIVSRSFPRKKKGMCILKNIPVVEPHMAICLASIVRDGIREIGYTRITNAGRNHKAHQLYDYIVSDRFVTRFREITESVESLRDHQQKEKDWHEDAWHGQTALYDTIDTRRRELDSQIKAIVKKSSRAEVLPLAARG